MEKMRAAKQLAGPIRAQAHPIHGHVVCLECDHVMTWDPISPLPPHLSQVWYTYVSSG